MNFSNVTISGAYISYVPPASPSTIEYLLVGGGASGASAPNIGGGGGGAGGLVTNAGLAVTAGTTYAVTIGAGGTGVAGSSGGGNNGVNSSLNPTYYGVFNGTSQYLSLPSNVAFAYGTGDFTIEMWYYFTGATSDTRYFFDQRTSAGGAQLAPAILLVSGVINVFLNGAYAIVGPTVTTSSWNHLALVRSSGVTKLYINGTQVGSNYTDANSYIASPMTIGATLSAVNTYNWSGYISNFRVVKGVAVYTGNFTVPTSPLTATQSAGTNISAITGTQTSLLTLQNATIVDNSTNAFAITNTGSVTTSAITPPFSALVLAYGGGTGGYYAPYTSASNGGSGGGATWNGTNITSYGSPTQPSSIWGGLGFRGGNGSGSYSGGGGGGAGAVGSDASGGTGGNGGIGYQSSISGSATYYAGGGGGGGVNSGTPGTGGTGGGGSSSTAGTSGVAGTANTGGGGGATTHPPSSALGGNGGSGIFILRYPSYNNLISSSTGSPTLVTSGGYNIYTWLSSGSFTFNLPTTPTVDYLIVAGGGGGAGNSGGGGGAGGLRTSTGLSVSPSTAYTVTVGSGGTAGQAAATTLQNGGAGVNSSIIGGAISISATGGGGGIGADVTPVPSTASGGSGGGGSYSTTSTGGSGNTGGYTPVEGYAGGNGTAGGGTGGGGGGASSVGGPASGSTPGNGGAGTVTTLITTTQATTYSVGQVVSTSVYFGGGGGGGSRSGSISLGGSGGGGAGAISNNAGTAGSPNTGGGGGGGGWSSSYGGVGSLGGYGVVIIRYADIYAAASTTGTPSINVANGYRTYIYTSSGSITF